MSMMCASGAMPRITALQMATASLAVPKSVMKTIVGCPPGCPGACTEFLCAGDFEQAAASRAQANHGKMRRRKGEIIHSPQNSTRFSRASVCRQVDIRQGAFLKKVLAAEAPSLHHSRGGESWEDS